MFSEAVDVAVARSHRTVQLSQIADFVNQTIRQLQAPNLYEKNLEEDQITATATPFIWTKPKRLQRLRTARYSNGVYPKFILPGIPQRDESDLFYSASTYFAFKNVDINSDIDIAYYQFQLRLQYFAVVDRPAVFNFFDETWAYDTASTDEQKAAAEALVSNWILENWYDLVIEGAMAKIYKLNANTERAATHFSAFERMRKEEFEVTEHFEALHQGVR